MKKIKSIIIGISLLAAMVLTTSLTAQQGGFTDSVKLKNGTILEDVKATVTKDSLVVTQPDGTTNVYTKKEVAEVKKNGKFGDATEPAKTNSAKTSSGKWSDYQGVMTVNDAFGKCENLGMRLPTIDELKAAYKAGVTQAWEKDGTAYWSSTPYGDDGTYYFDITNGYRHGNRRLDNKFEVRCIR